MRSARSVLERVAGTAVVAAAIPKQRRIPYLPEDELAELRDARLRETIAYAATSVPYYRDLFAREGIDPLEIRTAADLELLPLTSREEVRRNPDRT